MTTIIFIKYYIIFLNLDKKNKINMDESLFYPNHK